MALFQKPNLLCTAQLFEPFCTTFILTKTPKHILEKLLLKKAS